MSIRYKGDILAKLKEAGYTTTRLRNEKIFGERTIQEFRTNGIIPYKALDRLCRLLHCQPGDIMEYTEDVKDCGGIRPEALPSTLAEEDAQND